MTKTASQRAMDDVDKVAEAISSATSAGRLFPWSTLTELEREAWRAMAAAAIDALGLTEETRELTDGWIQPTRNVVYFAAGLTPPPAVTTKERRLVAAWTEYSA